MTERVRRLRESLRVSQFPICVEKAQIVRDSYVRNDGWPQIIRRARATADYMDQKTIFIEPDELIVGNVASRPMGMEMGSLGPGWPDDDLDDLVAGGQLSITDEDRKVLRSLDDYFLNRGRTQDEHQGSYYDDERLWPFIQAGFLCPPWTRRDQGRGQGAAGVGWGLGLAPTSLNCPDYAKIIHGGFKPVIEEAAERLKNLRYFDDESVYKADFYKACLIALPAMVRLANRYADLAEQMAQTEQNETRKQELLQIASICRRVPEHPARTFREGMQSFYFYWLAVASGTTPGGRFDQYMYPLYKADLAAGRITPDEALELLECLRIKIMQMNFVGGGKQQREKWAGMARWHNFIIGGCDSDGNDATNDLTYLMLDAAREGQTPHHTLTLRVNKNTPPELMKKAIEVVKTGIGMPAFISEDLYIKFLTDYGIDIREAREFAIAGCMDIMLPGRSRNQAFGMMLVPMILELALFNGINPRTGTRQGPATGEFASFKTYEDFYRAFQIQLNHIVGQVVEEHNILLVTQRELFPDVLHSAFFEGGLETGRDALSRTLKFENGHAVNMVGMVDTIDSLSAIKQLVFEEKRIPAQTLLDALTSDWDGYDGVRRLCLDAPKFGNDLADVDSLGAAFWKDLSKVVRQYRSAYGGTVLPTAISITSHAPGGALTGATPNGRRRGETFADGSISPHQGCDRHGPLAVLHSGMKIPQDQYMATLFNMKFHPSALQTEEEMAKLASMIRVYLTNGGKQIQFNIVGRDTLLAAKKEPKKYADLIVRVAGYSAYFVTLTERVQDELILRTELSL
jgi:pyruvate formate-lyase/glycerol dehydratase family glycyl radical enzyme